ncbi:MAG: hypothetical protein GXP15_11405 [Gammaproteobacteria bacterium]|nr:hypothetical protein [Gammaproteobacteria bacterium]
MSRLLRQLRFLVIVTSGLLTATVAIAGPGFISGTRISKGNFLAEITVQFNCGVRYIDHEPAKGGDQMRIRLESTGICRGVSPLVENIREQYRPADADNAKLVNLEYDGETPAGPLLRLDFSEPVRFAIRPSSDDNTIAIRVYFDAAQVTLAEPRSTGRSSRRVAPPAERTARYVINLASSRRPPGTADLPKFALDSYQSVFVSEAIIDQATWYRLRLGYFESARDASRQLARVRKQYPTAWIDRASGETTTVADVAAPITKQQSPEGAAVTRRTPANAAGLVGKSTHGPDSEAKLAKLMRDAHRAMTAGEISRAVQIYTKVLQQPANQYQRQAQEYLALARERNGQTAHAKAEYQRYLAVYPDGEGTARVRQRLSALLSKTRQRSTVSGQAADGRRDAEVNPWNIRTFFSQYYRRDVNQPDGNDDIISQSSVYSDINIDARRRGERYDFSSRITTGYRNDFLASSRSGGNDLRLSYAYADLADSKTGLRGRLGRQSRSNGGVLGRFDGINFSYQASEKLRVDTVLGKPVYSTADGVNNERTFYGISSNFGPIADGLDIGLFFLQQDINGIGDRHVVGSEVRYFAENKSLWGQIDYDTSFKEFGSMFLQSSWRLPSKLTISGILDRRRSPFLSTGNAVIGQSELSFGELSAIFTEHELRQLALDRAAQTTTITLGLSRPLTPKLQINLNASESAIAATPASGGVAATPATSYRYYSADMVASSLIAQGDVTIFGVRYADSDSTKVWSLNLDTRFPLGRSLRINPRMRVDYRQIKSDLSSEWILTPGLRLQYRWGRKVRLEFEAGKRFANRTFAESDIKRQSYFINFGYQIFY